MDIETIRAIERIIIDIFAGTSIILGWHLFKIGVVSPQSGTFSGKGFKFSLQKVGPGIFFSLFGTAILSVALIYGLTYEKEKNPNGTTTRTKISLANALQKPELKSLTEAINTLDLIDMEHSSPYKKHREAISNAVERLRAHRDRLARQKFDEKRLKAYQDCLRSSDKTCNQNESFQEIDKWLTENIL